MKEFQDIHQNNNNEEEKNNKCWKKKKLTLIIWRRTMPANEDLTIGKWVLGVTQKWNQRSRIFLTQNTKHYSTNQYIQKKRKEKLL